MTNQQQQGIWYLVIVVGICLGAAAFAQLRNTARDEKFISKVKKTPQSITAADLGQRGPGENLHVTVTQLEFGEDVLTIRNSRSSSWSRAYVPVYPRGFHAGGGNPGATPPLLLVQSSEIADLDQLRTFAARATVTGLVVNPLEGVPSEVETFKRKYPNFKEKDIWIVDVSRGVPTDERAEAGYFLGCFLTFCALGCLGLAGWMLLKLQQQEREEQQAARAVALARERHSGLIRREGLLASKLDDNERAADLVERWNTPARPTR